MTNFMVDWPELLALIFLIIGFTMALFAGNLIALYTLCILMGLFFGRLWYRTRLSLSVPIFMAAIGFLLGFALGGIWGNLRIIVLLLLAGLLGGYWLHKKKIIRTF